MTSYIIYSKADFYEPMVHSPPQNANRCSASQFVTAVYEAWRHRAPQNNSLRYTSDTTLYLQHFVWTFHLICGASPVYFIPQVLHHMLDSSHSTGCWKPHKLPTVQLLRWIDKQFILFFPSNLKNINDVVNEPRPLECYASGSYTSTQA